MAVQAGIVFRNGSGKSRRDGKLSILELTSTEADRMEALMAQYRDTPMDLADASLIAIAESRDLRRFFR